ncbi:swi5-like zinc finger protein [Gonapodya sp. JEL0774]|nr:swi5-like zinc finger protein [Gonapodya sp. JEL0774]
MHSTANPPSAPPPAPYSLHPHTATILSSLPCRPVSSFELEIALRNAKPTTTAQNVVGSQTANANGSDGDYVDSFIAEAVRNGLLTSFAKRTTTFYVVHHPTPPPIDLSPPTSSAAEPPFPPAPTQLDIAPGPTTPNPPTPPPTTIIHTSDDPATIDSLKSTLVDEIAALKARLAELKEEEREVGRGWNRSESVVAELDTAASLISVIDVTGPTPCTIPSPSTDFHQTTPRDQRPNDIDAAFTSRIQSLHDYNELKDLGQSLLGKLAELEGVTTRDMYARYGMDVDD